MTPLLSSLQANRGRAASLARQLELSQSFIWQMARGERPAPSDRCPAIERAEEGRTTCEQLRPDIKWVRVPDPMWPWHPAGRPLRDDAAHLVAEQDGHHPPPPHPPAAPPPAEQLLNDAALSKPDAMAQAEVSHAQ